MTITGGSAKFLIAALAVSAVLNVAAVGFAGSVIGGGYVLRNVLGGAAGAYPASLRQAFRETLRAHRGELFTALRQFRQARGAQYRAITAEHFDRSSVEAAQMQVRETGAALVTLLQSILTDSIATLPDDQRRALPRLAPFGMPGLSDLDASEPSSQ